MKSYKKFGFGVGIGLVIGILSLGISSSRAIYLSNTDPSIIMWLATIIVVVIDIYSLLKKRVALSLGIIFGFILPIIFLALFLLIGCLSSHVCT